mgnify:CR=1 FL=1
MNQLASIFLHMDTGQTDAFLLACNIDIDPAMLDDWQIILGRLPVLRQIRIVVVLAVEFAERQDVAMQGQAGFDGIMQYFFIEYGQDAGQGDIDGVGLDVGFGAERRRAAGKNLRVRLKLNVRLDADDDFPLIHNFIRFTNIGRFSIRRVSATNNRMPCPRTTSGSR